MSALASPRVVSSVSFTFRGTLSVLPFLELGLFTFAFIVVIVHGIVSGVCSLVLSFGLSFRVHLGLCFPFSFGGMGSALAF